MQLCQELLTLFAFAFYAAADAWFLWLLASKLRADAAQAACVAKPATDFSVPPATEISVPPDVADGTAGPCVSQQRARNLKLCFSDFDCTACHTAWQAFTPGETDVAVCALLNPRTGLQRMLMKSEMGCLAPHQWITNAVMTQYCMLLQLTNDSLPGSPRIRFPGGGPNCWELTHRRPDSGYYYDPLISGKSHTNDPQLFQCDMLLFPICASDHWLLVVAALKEPQLLVFDSQALDNSECYDLVVSLAIGNLC